MLSLTRREGESIICTDLESGRQVTITVVRVDRHQVRLGLEAPKEIEILRLELKAKPQGEPVCPI